MYVNAAITSEPLRKGRKILHRESDLPSTLSSQVPTAKVMTAIMRRVARAALIFSLSEIEV